METLFVLKNIKNRIIGKECFRSKESADYSLYIYRMNGRDDIYIDEIKVPFAKRSVCYLHLYRGYDYNFGGSLDIYTVACDSEIFSCTSEAKKHEWWRKAEEEASSDPAEFICNDTKIASKGDDDKEFIYGDALYGKFNLSIRRLKVRP